MLGWCLWLLGSWAVALGPKWFSLVPSVRYLGVAAVVGSMLFWPALRLSQERSDAPGRWSLPGPRGLFRIAFDWLGLNFVWSGVAMTMAAMGQWRVRQAAVVCVALAGWTMLAGMVVVWGLRGPVRRTLAMFVCVAMVFVPPLILLAWSLAGELGSAIGAYGPLAMLWAWTQAGRQDLQPGAEAEVMVVLLAAAAAFVITVTAVVIGSVGGYAGAAAGRGSAPGAVPPSVQP